MNDGKKQNTVSLVQSNFTFNQEKGEEGYQLTNDENEKKKQEDDAAGFHHSQELQFGDIKTGDEKIEQR